MSTTDDSNAIGLGERPEHWSAETCVGIDVSKDTLDACLVRRSGKPHHKCFDNTESGWSKMLRWVEHLCEQQDKAVHYCMEATGSYSMPLARFLHELGQFVSIVNPKLILRHGQSNNVQNKTDKSDAHTIADYCREKRPDPWLRPAAEITELQALVRRVHAVQELQVQEKNRLSAPGQPAAVLESLAITVSFLESEIKRLREQIRDLSNKHSNLRDKIALLITIPGIGEATAQELLAELPDIQHFDSAQSVAAFAGLSPRVYESGSSVRKRGRIGKNGNSRLRKALYFPAVSAMQWNPFVKKHYRHLLAQGKPKMVALVAAMRKLLMICYGVLKNAQPFQEEWENAPKAFSSKN